MVSRSEIDMLDIRREFLTMYGKSLHSFIKVKPFHVRNQELGLLRSRRETGPRLTPRYSSI